MKKIFLFFFIVLSFFVIACQKDESLQSKQDNLTPSNSQISKPQKVSKKITKQTKPFAKAQWVIGKVSVSQDGIHWTALKRNDKIYPLQWIKTEEKSRIKVVFWKNSSFSLSPNSLIQVKHFKEEKKGENQAEILVGQGKLISNIQRLNPKKGFYRIQGPAMVAGVRGTSFEFSSQKGKDTLIVQKGSVAAKRNVKNAPSALITKDKGTQAAMEENQKLMKNKKSLTLELVPAKRLRSGFVFFKSYYDD